MKALLDNRNGVINENTIIDNIFINEALLLLKKLDGKKHTIFSLEREDDFTLCVGGGSQFFIITIMNKDGDSKTLLNPLKHEKDKTIELCAGGQYADFPDKFVIDIDSVINAVKSFYLNQEEKMKWEKD
jgi:hypothetical protein